MASCKMPEEQQFTSSHAREFLKYYLHHHSDPHSTPISIAQQNVSSRVVRTSQDTALTAFAQLGALRLDARRAMISLFDRDHQYILAEATKTLSLQHDDVYVHGDKLWLGWATIPRSQGICQYTVSLSPKSSDSTSTDPRDCTLVIPDLTLDDRFKGSSFVVGEPYARFYAGAPIITPKGIPIGSYCIIDDKPRGDVDDRSLRFLRDMATTVMNHLDMNRSKEQTRRGQQMITGLGSFMEGNTSRPSLGGRIRTPSPVDDRRQESSHEKDRSKLLFETPHDAMNVRKEGINEKTPSPQADSVSRLGTVSQTYTGARDNVDFSSRDEDPLVTTGSTPRNASQDSRSDMLSFGVRETFKRAAGIVRHDLEVEGVVFLDATIGSYGGLVNQAKSHDVESENVTSHTSSSSEVDEASADLSPDSKDSGGTDESEQNLHCPILSCSTVNPIASAEYQGQPPKLEFPEKFLKTFIRHYPKGKVLNFDENGLLSSSESSDAYSEPSGPEETATQHPHGLLGLKSRTRRQRHQSSAFKEAETLLKIFPDARSIAFFPMWDPHRTRWFSACFAWSTKPMHIFEVDTELAYIYAFCNSIMVEVNRYDNEMESQAKANLVSSISHELRSPLHGILGSAEILGDTSLDALQHGIVHTIESCGRTLLDIINNLLDFAKINNFARSQSPKRKTKYRSRHTGELTVSRRKRGRPTPHSGLISLTSRLDLDILLEEVMDTVFSGHIFYQAPEMRFQGLNTSYSDEGDDYLASNSGHAPGDITSKTGPVTIIFSVDPTAEYSFRTEAGAWRRILMNLFGNSLKYTDSGFVSVTISASPLPLVDRGRKKKSRISLVVKDTGRGISKDYLENNMFLPFTQENSLNPGSGLGLSIVHQIVRSLQGELDIRSSKEVGTEVSISVDLPMSSKPSSPNEDGPKSFLKTVQARTSGKSITLIGFEINHQVDTGAMAWLSNSLQHTCKYSFGMNVDFVAIPTEPIVSDCFLVTQDTAKDLRNLVENLRTARGQTAAPIVVVLCQNPEVARLMAERNRVRPSKTIVEFISQPCGPMKLAKAFLPLLNPPLEAKGDQMRESAPILSNKKSPYLADSHESHESPATSKRMQKDDAQLSLSLSSQAPIVEGIIGEGPARLKDLGITVRETEVARLLYDRMVTPSTVQHRRSTKAAYDNVAPTKDTETTVLLVDDNPVNLRLLVAYMKKAGYAYVAVSNGLEAYKTFRSKPGRFQIVITDISMPVMDGLEMARQMRQFEDEHEQTLDQSALSSWRPTTILALSGLGSASVQQEAFGSGIDLFLSKPVRFDDLIGHLDTVLKSEVNSPPKD